MSIYRYIQPTYKLPVKGKWRVLHESDFSKMPKGDAELWDFIIGEYQRNPLSFFMAHGRPREDGGNDGLAFINDWENDLLLVTAPKQSGKTFQGAAKTLLYGIPTDPSWPCFKDHGVKWREWQGPKNIIISSYSWDNVKVVWDTYKLIAPRDELMQFSPNWGMFDNERGRQRDLVFHNIGKSVQMKCGTVLTFLCYGQNNVHFESRQADAAHLDEQCPEDKFNCITDRQRTRGDYTPIFMTLSGYIVDKRPDTGAHGWIKKKVVDGLETKGRKIGQYKIAVEDIPYAIMSEEKKKQMKEQWVDEPKRTKNQQMLRLAEASYWGGWERGGGIILNEWNPDLHFIEPFDLKKFKPTYYRIADHGQDPSACGLFAVLPTGEAILYKEYYEYGKNIDANAQGILAMCGNERRRVDDVEQSLAWPIYEEVQCGTQFRASELDCRCFQKKAPESGRLIGRVYNECGMFCTMATGQHDYPLSPTGSADKGLIPILKEWLAIDSKKVHINTRLGRKWNFDGYGAPKLYVFNTCVNFKKEIEGWIDRKCDDHLISVAKYFCARERPYMGDYGMDENSEETGQRPVGSTSTGY